MENVQPGKMLAARQHKPNSPLKIDQINIPEVGDGEVLVKMHAAPINPSDLATLTGEYTTVAQYPTIPGLEGSGTVIATGSGLLARRLKGKNVMCSAGNKGGSWAQFMVTKATKCIPLGKEISLEEGATMIVNPLTALVMMELARKKKAKAIINTAAASSLGKMLIKLCSSQNQPLINIVRKNEQVKELQHIGAKHVLNSSNPGFKEQLIELAESLEASLAFDALGGEMTGILLQVIQEGGEVKTYGGLSGEAPTFNNRELMLKNKVISGLYLANYMRNAGLLKALQLTGKLKKLVKNELKTTINQKFPLVEINEAIALYQSNMSQGKVLVFAHM